VVAHFHYVLSLGAVFALFAGFFYWIGKMSGKQYGLPKSLEELCTEDRARRREMGGRFGEPRGKGTR